MDIVSGEKIQLIANLNLGYSYDFQNPYIIENSKNVDFIDFRCLSEYDNPSLMFCYGHRIDELSIHFHKFKNPFILISHNSDCNISDCLSTTKIIECKNLIKATPYSAPKRIFFSRNFCTPFFCILKHCLDPYSAYRFLISIPYAL
jgi:hypothetical protein